MNDLGTDLSSVWRRAFRHRAEREATANSLRVRVGKSSRKPPRAAATVDGRSTVPTAVQPEDRDRRTL